MANSTISIVCKLILSGADSAKKNLQGLRGGVTSFAAAAIKGGVAIKALSASISAIKNVVFDTAGTFEKESSTLASVLGKSRDQISDLSMSARQLGRDTVYTANEVVQLQTALSRLGFSSDEIKNMEEPILKFAAAVGTDLPSASAFAGAALRAFGLESSQMGDLLDIMSASTTKSALDFEKLQESISVVAPVTHAFGLNAAQTASLLGVLANSGFRAETAAIAIRNIFTDLANSSGKIATAMGRPVRTFEDLISVLEELKNRNASLDELYKMTNKRSVAAMSVLVQNVDQLKELDTELQDVSGTMETMYATATDNVIDKTKILKSAWEEFKLTIANTGPFKDALDSMSSYLNEFTNMLKRNNKDAQDVWANDYAQKLSGGEIDYDEEKKRLEASRPKWGDYLTSFNSIPKNEYVTRQLEALDRGKQKSDHDKLVESFKNQGLTEDEMRDQVKQWQAELDSLRADFLRSSGAGNLDASAALNEINTKDYSADSRRIEELRRNMAAMQEAIDDTAESAKNLNVVVDEDPLADEGRQDKLKGSAKAYANLQKSIDNTISYYDLIGTAYDENAVKVEMLSQGLESLAKEYGTADGNVKKLYESLTKVKNLRDESLGAPLEKLPGIGTGLATTETPSPGLAMPETQKIDIQVTGEDKISAAVSVVSQLESALNDVGSAADGTASQWLKFVNSAVQSGLRLVATIVAMTAASESENASLFTKAILGSAASAAKVPFVGAALAVAAIASVTAALMSIPKYAEGGLAYGPTVGMFGEYPGARTNPEVVAPVSDLRKFFKPSQGGGKVEFRIEGRTLVGILNKEGNISRRS